MGLPAYGRQNAGVKARESYTRAVPRLRREVQSILNAVLGLIDQSESPEHQSADDFGLYGDIVAETGGEIAISFTIIGREGLFELDPGPGVVALEPRGGTHDAMRHGGFRVIPAYAGRRAGTPHPLRASSPVPPAQSYRPTDRSRRRILGGVFDACCKLASSRKGGARFQRGMASPMQQGISVNRLKAHPRQALCGAIRLHALAGLVRHRDRLAEMGDRLLERRAPQGLVARLAPPFDGETVEPGLGEMMGDELRLGRRALGIVAQDFRGAAVQRLAAALEQALVGRVLDQRMLEAIGPLRAGALDEEQVRMDEPCRAPDLVSRGRRPRLQRRAAHKKNRARAPRRSARLRALRRAGRAARRATAEASAGSPANRPVRRARAEAA